MKIPSMRTLLSTSLFLLAALPAKLSAQYGWPVTPFDASHWITGTFCEYRDTAPAPHFHNGVDIPKPDGSPVYAVADGYVTGLSRTGSNAYVRVGNFAYVHIQPSPNLSIGSHVVAHQTVLGTILPGQGHVHFIDGTYDHEINPLRPDGGLTPYGDPWPPHIDYVAFYADGSDVPFQTGRVAGNVDIVVKVSEWNGPASSPTSCRNNGSYELGFEILTSDTTTRLYRSGVRFRFDGKPSNSYVHNVFFRSLSSTSSHVYIPTNYVNRNSYLNTGDLGLGNYLALVWTRDTRGNADTLIVPFSVVEPDTKPPEPPAMQAVVGDAEGFTVMWQAPPDSDVVGYRLWYSFDGRDWKLRLDERQLPADCTQVRFDATLNRPIFFRVTAVDDAPQPNESKPSAIYGTRQGPDPLLIVDALTGEVNPEGNTMAFNFVGRLSTELQEKGFSICHLSAVAEAKLDLISHRHILFLLGQTPGPAFRAQVEQSLTMWLQSGASVFVSGARVVSTLQASPDTHDARFLSRFLGVRSVGRRPGRGSVHPTGPYTPQADSCTFVAAMYEPDSVDVLAPLGEAQAFLLYDDSTVAGVTRREVDSGAKVTVTGFPIETLADDTFLSDLVAFSIRQTEAALSRHTDPGSPATFDVKGAYPNPFNGTVRVTIELPRPGHLDAEVFDARGRSVRLLANRAYPAGRVELIWDGRDNSLAPLPSGVYILRVSFLERTAVLRLLLLR